MQTIEAKNDVIPLNQLKYDQHRTQAILETPSYLRNNNRHVLGSEAFNLNYDAQPTSSELRRDIVSYLGEYRLQVQKYDYELVYGRDRYHRGELTLRDQDRGESLQIMAKRTLESRRLDKKPSEREEAEDYGLRWLNAQLRSSKTGDTVIWASPPGPKEQGYGDYGFLFAGKVKALQNGEKKISMTAIRVENPKEVEGLDPWIEQFGSMVNSITGKKKHYKRAEDFLASPQVIDKEIESVAIDTIIQKSFKFAPNENERGKMNAIIKKMDPLINEFINRMDLGTEEDRLKAFYALENYALELKYIEEAAKNETVVYESITISSPKLDELIRTHSYLPPPVAGSCGRSANGLRGNNLSFLTGPNISRGIMSGGSSREPFKCPDCSFTTTSSIGNTCPDCGLTKEEFAQRTGVKCD